MDPQAEEKLSITATETGTHCAPVATHWKYLCISLASTIAAWVLWQNYSIPGGHQETASPYTTKRRLNSYLLPIGKFSDPRKIVNKEEQLVVPSTTQVESNGASAVPFGHAVEDSSNNKQHGQNSVFVYEQEFPYPLTCNLELPPKTVGVTYDISIVYHVGMVKNWRNVVIDQLHTLQTCGLGAMSSALVVSYSKGTEESVDELEEIINSFSFTKLVQITYHEVTAVPWEQEAIRAISRYCTNKGAAEGEKKFVYYFHNKGVSHYKETWKDSCVELDRWGYCKILYWRKYMEWFLIEKPTLCLRAMIHHDALTCGVQLRKRPRIHYSGNFWAASCDYIKTLPSEPDVNIDLGPYDGKYLSAEMWIGTALDESFNVTQHVSFFESLSVNIVNLYSNLILPEQYSNISNFVQGDHMYANIWLDYLGGLEEQ